MVQRVEEEPLMSEGAPPGFDHGVREPQLRERQDPAHHSRGDQVVDLGISRSRRRRPPTPPASSLTASRPDSAPGAWRHAYDPPNSLSDNAPTGMKPYRVFFSHGSDDTYIVENFLKPKVASSGAHVFVDAGTIGYGDDFRALLLAELGDLDELLVLLTKSSLRRPWVLAELGAALVKKETDCCDQGTAPPRQSCRSLEFCHSSAPRPS